MGRNSLAFKTGKHRILVAEDSHQAALIVTTMLNECGYEVDLVSNGDDALSRLMTGLYDLALMDIQMGEMSGLDMTRRFREWERGQGHKSLPIVGCSAQGMIGDMQEAIEAGMTAYITKPYSFETLQKTTAGLVSGHR